MYFAHNHTVCQYYTIMLTYKQYLIHNHTVCQNSQIMTTHTLYMYLASLKRANTNDSLNNNIQYLWNIAILQTRYTFYKLHLISWYHTLIQVYHDAFMSCTNSNTHMFHIYMKKKHWLEQLKLSQKTGTWLVMWN